MSPSPPPPSPAPRAPVPVPQAPELRAQQAHQGGPQAAAGDQVFHHEGREQVDVEGGPVQPAKKGVKPEAHMTHCAWSSTWQMWKKPSFFLSSFYVIQTFT